MRSLLPAILLLSPFASGAATVYECVGPEGRITFSDVGCRAHAAPRSGASSRGAPRLGGHRDALGTSDGHGGAVRQRRVVIPNPDAAPALREGERRLLEEIEADDRLERQEKQDARERFLREWESYGERLRRRNEEMRRKHERERQRGSERDSG